MDEQPKQESESLVCSHQELQFSPTAHPGNTSKENVSIGTENGII